MEGTEKAAGRAFMTLKVLKERKEVARARAELRRRRIDCATPFWEKVLRKTGAVGGLDVGDRLKSWDLLETVRFVEENVPRDALVLDIGACACEVLPVLDRLGYTGLWGIDLDPRVLSMPAGRGIRYLVADFMETPFFDGTFACVTALSVIEHGFDGRRLFSEVARILRPGGFFIASFDYWPEKIRTDAITAYGMSWTIFSREEVGGLLGEARSNGLVPIGSLDFTAGRRVAKWHGKRFTFAWLVLAKVPPEPT